MNNPHDAKISNSINSTLISLSRNTKRAILCLGDGVVFSVSLWLSMSIRYGAFSFPKDERLDGLYFVLPIVGVATYWLMGLYLSMVRSMESRTIFVIAFGALVVSLFIPVWAYFDPMMNIPRSVPIVYGMLAMFGVGAIRLILRELYQLLTNQQSDAQKIIIYGAGTTGTQIAAMIQNAPQFRIMGFVDDNPKLEGARIRGRRIYSPSKLPDLVNKYSVRHVLLALGNIPPNQLRQIVQRLTELNVSIKAAPQIADISQNSGPIKKLQSVRIEDLLGRQTVAPNHQMIRDGVNGKNVLVTGAAGSIGSEICRQLLAANPARVIAYDVSEYGLYDLERNVSEGLADGSAELVLKLGSVLDRVRMRQIMKQYDIELVYHAAAYKHVPMVENNVLIAIKNNVFGTQIVAEEAVAAKVERFVLVSTDKAVRPTSVMGSTKRLAELVVQELQTRSENTILSMVRFGNVLGSSGSVIPLFNSQIDRGGPLTLTHKEVTRYFMTTPEAAQLVMQAGFLATGGEVFVLDMGEPVKLLDLARLMIRLSGNNVLEDGQLGEGIAIKEIGLRPGEKLYEELLVGDNASGTSHPKIMRAMEVKLGTKELEKHLSEFEKNIKNANQKSAVAKLENLVGLKSSNLRGNDV